MRRTSPNATAVMPGYSAGDGHPPHGRGQERPPGDHRGALVSCSRQRAHQPWNCTVAVAARSSPMSRSNRCGGARGAGTFTAGAFGVCAGTGPAGAAPGMVGRRLSTVAAGPEEAPPPSAPFAAANPRRACPGAGGHGGGGGRTGRGHLARRGPVRPINPSSVFGSPHCQGAAELLLSDQAAIGLR